MVILALTGLSLGKHSGYGEDAKTVEGMPRGAKGDRGASCKMKQGRIFKRESTGGWSI